MAACSPRTHARIHRLSIHDTFTKAYLAQFCLLTNVISGISLRYEDEAYVREFMKRLRTQDDDDEFEDASEEEFFYDCSSTEAGSADDVEEFTVYF